MVRGVDTLSLLPDILTLCIFTTLVLLPIYFVYSLVSIYPIYWTMSCNCISHIVNLCCMKTCILLSLIHPHMTISQSKHPLSLLHVHQIAVFIYKCLILANLQVKNFWIKMDTENLLGMQTSTWLYIITVRNSHHYYCITITGSNTCTM